MKFRLLKPFLKPILEVKLFIFATDPSDKDSLAYCLNASLKNWKHCLVHVGHFIKSSTLTSNALAILISANCQVLINSTFYLVYSIRRRHKYFLTLKYDASIVKTEVRSFSD